MQIVKPQKSLLQRQNSIWKSFLLLKLLEINWRPLKLLIDIRQYIKLEIPNVTDQGICEGTLSLPALPENPLSEMRGGGRATTSNTTSVRSVTRRRGLPVYIC